MNKWILLEHRLPEKDVDVLVSDGKKLAAANIVHRRKTKRGYNVEWLPACVEDCESGHVYKISKIECGSLHLEYVRTK